MFLVSLSVAILVAALIPLHRMLLFFVDPLTLRNLAGPFGTHLVVMGVRYVVPALVLYWVLRRSGVRYTDDAWGRWIMSAGCFMVLLFGLARAVASTVQGGGGSFVLAQLSPLVMWPSWLLIGVGLVRYLWIQPMNRETSAAG